MACFPNSTLDAGSTLYTGDTPQPLRRALSFIDEHAGDPITLDEIAAAARLSPRGVQAAFRRHLDTTPLSYLRGVRMERAHRDLQGAEPGTASAWQHWLPSGASPILVVSPSITGADSARTRARRYVAELRSRALSVGSSPVETSRCATSPILLWVIARSAAQLVEGSHGVHLIPGHQIAHAPLDDHPIVQRILQLRGQFVGIMSGDGCSQSGFDHIAIAGQA